AFFQQIACLAAAGLGLLLGGCSAPSSWVYSDRPVNFGLPTSLNDTVPVPPNPVVNTQPVRPNPVVIRQVSTFPCPNCAPPASAAGQDTAKATPTSPRPHTFPQALHAYFCCLHSPPPPGKEQDEKENKEDKKEGNGEKKEDNGDKKDNDK